MTLYVTVETPMTAEEIAGNDRLIAVWEALTDVLTERDILYIEDYDITRPTVHRELVRAEGPEREPRDFGPLGPLVRMIPVRTPFSFGFQKVDPHA